MEEGKCGYCEGELLSNSEIQVGLCRPCEEYLGRLRAEMLARHELEKTKEKERRWRILEEH